MKTRKVISFAVVAFVIAALLLAAYLRFRASSSDPQTSGSNSRISDEVRSGQLDEAIVDEQAELVKDPRNLQVIASLGTLCLLKARKVPPEEAEKWISLGAGYAREVGETASKDDALDIANIYEAGKILENAGDLSSTNKCLYYGQAKSLLENDGPQLKAGTAINAPGGPGVSADQLLAVKAALIKEIDDKRSSTHCSE
jgi:hypothetical protein